MISTLAVRFFQRDKYNTNLVLRTESTTAGNGCSLASLLVLDGESIFTDSRPPFDSLC